MEIMLIQVTRLHRFLTIVAYKMLKEAFPDTEPNDADWIYDENPSHLKSTPVKRGEIRWNFEKVENLKLSIHQSSS